MEELFTFCGILLTFSSCLLFPKHKINSKEIKIKYDKSQYTIAIVFGTIVLVLAFGFLYYAGIEMGSWENNNLQ